MARKTYRRKYSRKGRHTIKARHTRKAKKARKARKYTRKDVKGLGNGYDKVDCCVCGNEINKSEGLIPNACLQKNGVIRAHRMCEYCWFGKNKFSQDKFGPNGFATEGISHKCPGCESKLPLIENRQTTQVFDLTEDDD
jgi:hypothetical protein